MGAAFLKLWFLDGRRAGTHTTGAASGAPLLPDVTNASGDWGSLASPTLSENDVAIADALRRRAARAAARLRVRVADKDQPPVPVACHALILARGPPAPAPSRAPACRPAAQTLSLRDDANLTILSFSRAPARVTKWEASTRSRRSVPEFGSLRRVSRGLRALVEGAVQHRMRPWRVAARRAAAQGLADGRVEGIGPDVAYCRPSGGYEKSSAGAERQSHLHHNKQHTSRTTQRYGNKADPLLVGSRHRLVLNARHNPRRSSRKPAHHSGTAAEAGRHSPSRPDGAD